MAADVAVRTVASNLEENVIEPINALNNQVITQRGYINFNNIVSSIMWLIK